MPFLGIIGFIGLFGFGLLQMGATIVGLEYWFGGYKILAIIIGIFIGYMPFIGGILGIIGAVKVWHWSWWMATLLFMGVPLLGVLIIIVGGSFNWIKDVFFKISKTTKDKS